jgi:hypothetical protein
MLRCWNILQQQSYLTKFPEKKKSVYPNLEKIGAHTYTTRTEYDSLIRARVWSSGFVVD